MATRNQFQIVEGSGKDQEVLRQILQSRTKPILTQQEFEMIFQMLIN